MDLPGDRLIHGTNGKEGKNMHITLASGSPRRRQILEQVGFRNFTVLPSEADEKTEPGLPPATVVEELSRRKARAVAHKVSPGELVLAADTVVALEDTVLGKPRNEVEAEKMLIALSGRTHAVYTGLTLIRDGKIRTEHEVTAVTFRSLSSEEIQAYVACGEPMDKAGAYGIQGRGALLVERLEGDYFNVMGLPVCRLGRMLQTFGVKLLTREAAPLLP